MMNLRFTTTTTVISSTLSSRPHPNMLPFALVFAVAASASSLSSLSSLSSSFSSLSSSSSSSSSPYPPPLWSDVCTATSLSYQYPFCDTNLTHQLRSSDLVGRLTPDEKIGLLRNDAKPIARLGIPAYQWWSEGLHGPLEPCVSAVVTVKGGAERIEVKCPTSLPAPSAMSASFNDTLFRAAGAVTGAEGRAINNLLPRHGDGDRRHGSGGGGGGGGRTDGVRRVGDGTDRIHIGGGLTYWAPNANLQRDPRWGRNMEAPGEDPYLSSRYVSRYVRGMQEGNDDNGADMDGVSPSPYVQIAAACKHFVGNELEHSYVNGTGGKNATLVTRHNFDAVIPLSDLRDYYLVPFEACVRDGRSIGMMCSYNSVNGVPMCANKPFLTDVLRQRWGFDGYVTSDCGAVRDVCDPHRYAPDYASAAAYGWNAGCDVDCGSVYGTYGMEALNRSLVNMDVVDASLMRLVQVQMRLGLFDRKDVGGKNGTSRQSYFDPSAYGIDTIDSKEHRAVAYDAALQSIVLLKNDNGTLPLLKNGIGAATAAMGDGASTTKTIALIGPHVESRVAFLSNYHGIRCSDGTDDCIASPLEAITEAAGEGVAISHARGCGIADGSGIDNGNAEAELAKAAAADELDMAIRTANASDVVILLMGIDTTQEREELDRSTCVLPGSQPKLITSILELGKPTILVLIHGGAICLGDEIRTSVPAIIDAFYGGQYAAQALAEVLFGTYNPSGKMPVTMYKPEYIESMPVTQMSVSKPPGRTHLYYSGPTEFEFGMGLSYSEWKLKVVVGPGPADRNAWVSTSNNKTVSYTVRLTNDGPMPGRQRVLAYLRFPDSLGGDGAKVEDGDDEDEDVDASSVRGGATKASNVAAFATTATADATKAKIVTSMPVRRLWSYGAVDMLNVGQSVTLDFELDVASALAVSDAQGRRLVHPGEYDVFFTDGTPGNVVRAESALRIIGDGPVVVEESIFSHPPSSFSSSSASSHSSPLGQGKSRGSGGEEIATSSGVGAGAGASAGADAVTESIS